MRLFGPQPLQEALMNSAFVPTLDMVCIYTELPFIILFPAHADNFDDDEDRALIAPEVDQAYYIGIHTAIFNMRVEE